MFAFSLSSLQPFNLLLPHPSLAHSYFPSFSSFSISLCFLSLCSSFCLTGDVLVYHLEKMRFVEGIGLDTISLLHFLFSLSFSFSPALYLILTLFLSFPHSHSPFLHSPFPFSLSSLILICSPQLQIYELLIENFVR